MRCINLLFFILLLYTSAFTQVSEYIHIDQIGYPTDATKVAVLSDPITGYNSGDSYTPGSTMEVRNFLTDEVEYTGSPTTWNSGATHVQSGDKGWWFDFTTVSTPGTYYLYDPTNEVSSPPFEINSNPYAQVLPVALKMFYYNRCNAQKESNYVDVGFEDSTNFLGPLQDSECRYVYDQSNTALEKDLSGGWFDAGDYNKYVTFAHSVIHDLSAAYESSSLAFGDAIGIPESGDGLSDLLNEMKWELDWLMKMTNNDGTVHLKMGSISYSDNASAPPSNNTDPRYYGPVCTSASIAIASMFARAALIYENESGSSAFAQDLEERAIDCWQHFKAEFDNNSLDFDCDDGTIKAGDADWDLTAQTETAITAAVYLYELTGDVAYNNFFVDHYADVEHIATGYWGPYRMPLTEALLRYTTLVGNNSTASNEIITAATDALNNNYEDFYLPTTADLYRAHEPDYMYSWGSNSTKTNLANVCLLFKQYDLVPSLNSNLEEKAAAHLHYMHGVNPLGLVMLSNIYNFGGDRCVDEVYHTWFADGTDWDNVKEDDYGPAPGFVTGGPNQYYSGTITPPAGQPILKSYAQFNNDWPDNSWEITEPAIYYQSSYVRLLAAFTNDDVISSTSHIQVSNNCVKILPNPANNYFKVTGLLDNYTISVLDNNGNIYSTVTGVGSEAVIDIDDLPVGTFFIHVENDDHAEVCVQKIIKAD